MRLTQYKLWIKWNNFTSIICGLHQYPIIPKVIQSCSDFFWFCVSQQPTKHFVQPNQTMHCSKLLAAADFLFFCFTWMKWKHLVDNVEKSRIAKNNRFSKMFRKTIWIDLYNLQTLIDHVVKENWINVCFFVVFGWWIGLVFELFLSDNVGTTFRKGKWINWWIDSQQLLFDRRCLHWWYWWELNHARRFWIKLFDWHNGKKSRKKCNNQHCLVKDAKAWYLDGMKRI